MNNSNCIESNGARNNFRTPHVSVVKRNLFTDEKTYLRAYPMQNEVEDVEGETDSRLQLGGML